MVAKAIFRFKDDVEGPIIPRNAIVGSIKDPKVYAVDQDQAQLISISIEKLNEERVHFSMVCASYSCPPLLDEAYEGFKLNEQLNEQARLFFNDEAKNKFDLKERTAYLSKILDWYSSDFGNDDKSILLYVSQFLDSEIADDIKRNTSKWEIDHLSYNWDLNEIK